jgi:hypothetical protein
MLVHIVMVTCQFMHSPTGIGPGIQSGHQRWCNERPGAKCGEGEQQHQSVANGGQHLTGVHEQGQPPFFASAGCSVLGSGRWLVPWVCICLLWDSWSLMKAVVELDGSATMTCWSVLEPRAFEWSSECADGRCTTDGVYTPCGQLNGQQYHWQLHAHGFDHDGSTPCADKDHNSHATAHATCETIISVAAVGRNKRAHAALSACASRPVTLNWHAPARHVKCHTATLIMMFSTCCSTPLTT